MTEAETARVSSTHGTIELVEEGNWRSPDYSGQVFTDQQLAEGAHRRWVGGRYDDVYAESQRDFLRDHGMRPEHTLIDVGCGSFRAGRHLIDYLEPSHYFGVDANRSVMQAGYDLELTDEQRARLPVSNLRANDRFDVDFNVGFDYGMAQSVFSHVSLNHVRLCLFRVAKAMKIGGRFYATFFEEPPSVSLDRIRVSKRAKQRFSERNVFWYYRSDLEWAASFAPWTVNYIGDWGQPAKQMMMEFVRRDL